MKKKSFIRLDIKTDRNNVVPKFSAFCLNLRHCVSILHHSGANYRPTFKIKQQCKLLLIIEL